MSLHSITEIAGELFPDLAPPESPKRPGSARQQQREADWRQQLARAYAYQEARAATDEERQALEREYEEALANERHALARCRRGSTYMQAPHLSVDRNALARIKFMLESIRRGTWGVKEKGFLIWR